MKNEMRLQGIGLTEGTPAINIKVGDTLIWNYGCTSLVTSIEYSKTGKTLKITTNCDNKEYVRKMTSTRLVCIKKVA